MRIQLIQMESALNPLATKQNYFHKHHKVNMYRTLNFDRDPRPIEKIKKGNIEISSIKVHCFQILVTIMQKNPTPPKNLARRVHESTEKRSYKV